MKILQKFKMFNKTLKDNSKEYISEEFVMNLYKQTNAKIIEKDKKHIKFKVSDFNSAEILGSKKWSICTSKESFDNKTNNNELFITYKFNVPIDDDSYLSCLIKSKSGDIIYFGDNYTFHHIHYDL